MTLNDEIFDIHYNKYDSVNNHLKKNEALNDFEIAFILLTTSCISFHLFYETNKIIIQNRYKKIYEQINSKSTISFNEFINALKELGKNIRDMHSYISFLEPKKETPTFLNFSERLYSFISLENFTKEKLNYICKEQNLIFSNLEVITKNTTILLNKFYAAPTIDHKYKIIVFTERRQSNNLILKSDNDMHFEMTPYIADFSMIEKFRKKFNSHISTFWELPDFTTPEKQYYEWYSYLEKTIDEAKCKKVLIIDNRGNLGGNPGRLIHLFESLFGLTTDKIPEKFKNEKEINLDDFETPTLLSYSIAKSSLIMLEDNPYYLLGTEQIKKTWKKYLKKYNKQKNNCSIYIPSNKNNPWWMQSQDFVKNYNFTGTIILIFDTRTASTGEALYEILKMQFHYEKIIIIGSNSSGCIAYCNPNCYKLPNSKVHLSLTCAYEDYNEENNYIRTKVEGIGFIPDYWICSEIELYNIINQIIGEIQ